MGWSNIVIEAYCFGEKKDNKYPCGQRYPTVFCLQSGHCPHFAYAKSSEREAAWFVPLHLLIWDRVKSVSGTIRDNLTWYVWHRWFFKKQWAEFKEHVKTHTVECPEWDKQLEESKDKFPEWFEKAKKEENQ